MDEIKSEARCEYGRFLLALAQELDITETQFNSLVTSYGAVGEYLEKDPDLEPYSPVVCPQGSLRLGIIIRPINDDDDLDVDLVCRLNGKDSEWTQKDVKNRIGHRLKDHKIYSTMLQEEGRRCWTLQYRQNSDNLQERYHMDILPCVGDRTYDERVDMISRSDFSVENIRGIDVRITDNRMPTYDYSTDLKDWMVSNPDGYAIWFAHRCQQNDSTRVIRDIIPIGKYNAKKTVLQRVIQILKRHRDYMFRNDTDNKPISIIITTLAGRAYNGEANIVDAIVRVVGDMEKYITHDTNGKCVICNPVNLKENFADKWGTYPRRKENFFKWLDRVKSDLEKILSSKITGLQDCLSEMFGEDVVKRVFLRVGEDFKRDLWRKVLKVSLAGILGSSGKELNAKNTFYGKG